MYENKKNKENIYIKLFLVSIVIGVIFIAGFVSGGSLIYGLSSSDVDDLQYQIDMLKSENNTNEVSNIVYYYNDTSISDIYKEVKDSIVVISGFYEYQTFRRTLYYEVEGSGFLYEYNDEMVIITNNHVVSDVSDIVVTFSDGNSYPGVLIGYDAYSDLAVLSVDAPSDITIAFL